MSKKANPTTVGAFIVGAVVLGVAGVLTFGGGNFFEEEFKLVAFFEDSTAGLDLGAPVRFKGVQVGTVSSINAVWDGRDDSLRIPVELTLVRGIVRLPEEASSGDPDFDDPIAVMKTLIDRGLRAELGLDSFVTGKLFVALELHSDSPPRFVGDTKLPEIPTTEARLTKLAKSLTEIPFEKLVQRAIAAIDAVTKLLDDPGTTELPRNANTLVRDVTERLGPLAESTEKTLEEARQLMRHADTELATLSNDLHRLLEDADEKIGPTTAATIEALDQIRATLARIDAVLGEGYKLPYRAGNMIDEMTATARAIRVLAELIERNPEAILSGKPGR